jgi:hypothetical protein
MGKLYSFWGEGMGTLLELMVEGACRQLQRACVRGQTVFDAGEGVSIEIKKVILIVYM